MVMMEGRKWEELPTDCLVDVLGRVGMGSLLLDIPFVCKSWYKASLNPFCWKQLDFYDYDIFSPRFVRQYAHGKFSEIKHLKGVISRSAGCATHIELPSLYAVDLSYVADNCPALKMLVVGSTDLSIMLALSSVVGKFKNLVMLNIRRSGSFFKDIVTQIGAHCQNFTTLNLVSQSYYHDSIGEDEVMTMVSCLPKLKYLTLNRIRIERDNLMKLLNGCVGLVDLDVSGCYGFDENDEELLKLASHIQIFKFWGSVVNNYEDEDEDVGYDYGYHRYEDYYHSDSDYYHSDSEYYPSDSD